MPLLEYIATERGRQIGTLEDGTRVLLSNPYPFFKSQEVSKGASNANLRDFLKAQAREDKTYSYQIGTHEAITSSLGIITYIRWEGELIEE